MKVKTSFFIKGFTQLASLTFLSRVSGFIRDIFIATFLGAGILSDVFLIAFKTRISAFISSIVFCNSCISFFVISHGFALGAFSSYQSGAETHVPRLGLAATG